MNNVWVIAQTQGNGSTDFVKGLPMDGAHESTTTDESGANSNPPGITDPNNKTPLGPNAPGPMLYVFWGLMLVMLYFMLFRGPKKKQQEHKKMVQALKKNDRVRTVGGILGTVIDVKDDEVVLKIDESTNTKIRVSTSAIGTNLSKNNE